MQAPLQSGPQLLALLSLRSIRHALGFRAPPAWQPAPARQQPYAPPPRDGGAPPLHARAPRERAAPRAHAPVRRPGLERAPAALPRRAYARFSVGLAAAPPPSEAPLQDAVGRPVGAGVPERRRPQSEFPPAPAPGKYAFSS